MAVRPEELSRPRPRRRAACAPLFGLLLTAGCVSLGAFRSADAPPTGAVYQVVATWNSQVVFADDPTHGGAATPGLAGRVYLFGPQIDFPLEGNGPIVVDLYDRAGPKPVMLEEWRFDKDTLKRLLRKDMVGWGYTLFLPWGTYRQDIKRVQLKVRYEPPQGLPIYAESSPLTLNAVQDYQASSKSGPPPEAAAAAAGNSAWRPVSASQPAAPAGGSAAAPH